MMESKSRCWCSELQGSISSTKRGFFHVLEQSGDKQTEEAIMARLSWTQRLYWRYFSKPVGHRPLYLYAIENPVQSILEIGIGNGERIKQVLTLCSTPEGGQIRYAGVDPFESATDGRSHLPLKSAHRMLAEFGVRTHLIPGDPTNALPRVAHTILPSDLVIIDGEWQSNSAQGNAIQTWLPRLCHAKSAIFASTTTGGPLVRVPAPVEAIDQSTLRKAA